MIDDAELIAGLVTCPSCQQQQDAEASQQGESENTCHYRCDYCGYDFARVKQVIPAFLRRQAD